MRDDLEIFLPSRRSLAWADRWAWTAYSGQVQAIRLDWTRTTCYLKSRNSSEAAALILEIRRGDFPLEKRNELLLKAVVENDMLLVLMLVLLTLKSAKRAHFVFESGVHFSVSSPGEISKFCQIWKAESEVRKCAQHSWEAINRETNWLMWTAFSLFTALELS